MLWVSCYSVVWLSVKINIKVLPHNQSVQTISFMFQTFMIPKGFSLMTLVIPLLFI